MKQCLFDLNFFLGNNIVEEGGVKGGWTTHGKDSRTCSGSSRGRVVKVLLKVYHRERHLSIGNLLVPDTEMDGVPRQFRGSRPARTRRRVAASSTATAKLFHDVVKVSLFVNVPVRSAMF